MALLTPIQVYRGTRTNLAALASTGHAGIIAWTTDSNEFFVGSGTGTGIGAAWLPLGSSIAVFSAADQTAMVALAAKVGDLCTRADNNRTYILTAFPASTPANWVPIAVTSGTTITGLASGTAHEWVSYIDASGVQHLSQPAFSDISGQLSQAQLPSVIDCGTF
jgi:hypothetical protein